MALDIERLRNAVGDLGDEGRPDDSRPPDGPTDGYGWDGGKSLPATIRKGSRHDRLLSYAGGLQAAGLTDDEIERLVGEANGALCEPPLPEMELWTLLKSVLKYEKGAGGKQKGTGRLSDAELTSLLVDEYHARLIDGVPAIWSGGRYRTGAEPIERILLEIDGGLSRNRRREILSRIRLSAPHVEMGPPRYVAFSNGVFDLKTGEILDNAPGLGIPNVIPHDLDPRVECDEVDRCLDDWACGRRDVREVLEETVGLCMYRGREFAHCPILVGGGSNGKSTFLKMLRRLLGGENVSSLDLADVGGRFQGVALMGRLANICDDISSEYLTARRLATAKKIISGDTMKVEYKGGDIFDITPYCTMVFTCNEMPRLGDRSRGMFRRLVLVPFDATFSREAGNVDLGLVEALGSERAIRRLAVLGLEGLRRCIANGGMTMTREHRGLLDGVRMASSNVYQFAREILGLGTDHEEAIVDEPSGPLWDRYLDFCASSGLKSVCRRQFSQDLADSFELKTGKVKKGGRGFVSPVSPVGTASVDGMAVGESDGDPVEQGSGEERTPDGDVDADGR